MTASEKLENKESPGFQEVKYVPTGGENLKPQNETRKHTSFNLYFIVITGTLLPLAGGANFTWPSPVIPKLKSNDTSVNPLGEPATTFEISMMVGLPVLTGLIGSITAAPISDFMGRKRLIQILGLAMFISNTIVAFSNKIILILVFRGIFFIFFLGSVSVMTIIITEVCESHNRAKFGCFLTVNIPLGCLYSYLFGPFFSVRIFTLFINIPILLFLVLFCFVHETPVYLLSLGKREECLASLRFLRNNKNSKEIDMDLKEIETTLKARQSAKQGKFLDLFRVRNCRVGLILALVPTFFYHTSGATILVAFLGPILNEAHTNISGDTGASIVGAVKAFSFILTALVVEKTGRRPLLIISSVGSSLALFTLGLYYYLKYINSPLVDSLQWLPLAGMLGYIIMFSSGLGPIPLSLIGELFTSDIRSVAISFILAVVGFIAFLVTSGFPLMSEYLGLHWCMWIFSIDTLLGAICFYLFLPETRGKSLMEIQEILENYRLRFGKSV